MNKKYIGNKLEHYKEIDFIQLEKSIRVEQNKIGNKIEHYKIIDSTQLEIHRRIEQNNIENGLIIIADKQTNGKGTHGRIWHTDEDNNIAFSLYIETDCKYQKLDGITIEIAKIILRVFKNLYQINLQIKEPNDIVYNGKKIGGILTESKILKDKVKYLVIGIGINTNKQQFPEDIKNIATSIKKEFNIIVKLFFMRNVCCSCMFFGIFYLGLNPIEEQVLYLLCLRFVECFEILVLQL